MVDGAGVAVALAASESPDAAKIIFGTNYLLGSPIVHGAHGRVGAAFASFGLRLALPAVGAYAMCGFGGRHGDCLPGAVLGIAVGSVTAIAIDASALAWEEAPRTRTEALGLTPTLQIAKGTLGLGVGGAF